MRFCGPQTCIRYHKLFNNPKMSEQTNQFKEFISEGKEYLKLRLEYGKLTVTEKLSILLSNLAVGMIGVLLAVIAFFFLSMAAIDWMAGYLGATWSCLIMAGLYLLLIVSLIVFRKPLILNPMARMISRIILK